MLIITKPNRVADLTKFAKIAKNRKSDDFSRYLQFLAVLCHVKAHFFACSRSLKCSLSLKERGTLHLKSTKWLESRGLSNRGEFEMTGYPLYVPPRSLIHKSPRRNHSFCWATFYLLYHLNLVILAKTVISSIFRKCCCVQAFGGDLNALTPHNTDFGDSEKISACFSWEIRV